MRVSREFLGERRVFGLGEIVERSLLHGRGRAEPLGRTRVGRVGN